MCRKILYISAVSSLVFFINQAIANDFALSGKLNLQYGFNDNDFSRILLNADSNLEYSYHINDYFSTGSFIALSTNLTSNNIDDSGKAKNSILDVTSSTKSAYVFLKSSNAGALQIGLTSPVSQKMKLSSSSISVASGGVTGSWLEYVNFKTDKPDFSYGKNSEDTVLFVPDLYIAYHGSSIPVINYYSPNMKGAEFGFSYILKDKPKTISNTSKHIYEDIISIGVKYQNQLFSKIDYSISGVVEHAISNALPEYNDLLSYSAGFSLKYNNVTFVGSYANLSKSGKKGISISTGTSQNTTYEIINSSFYDLGVKVESNGFNISFSYFYGGREVSNSSTKNSEKHSLSACALGIEKPLPNKMIIYTDIVFFDGDRSSVPITNKSGYVALVGAKLSF